MQVLLQQYIDDLMIFTKSDNQEEHDHQQIGPNLTRPSKGVLG